MKSKIFLVITFAMLAGCANHQMVMKTDKKYFKPMKTYAELKKTSPAKTKLASTMLQKELDEKNTMIELLSKENQQLRERVAKLEKKLAITNS
jgi:hypothetical protein